MRTLEMRKPISQATLVLIGTGGVKRRPVLERLRELGIGRIVCVNDKPNWAAPLVDELIVADSVHPDGAALAALRSRFEHAPPDAVFTYDEYSVVLTAHAADQFGCIGISPGVAELVKDKAAFRQRCRAAGLPAPGSMCVGIGEAVTAAALANAGIVFPVVAKPRFGGGSVFVRRLEDLRALQDYIRWYEHAIAADPIRAFWRNADLVIEEYLDGDEVDIDVLMQDGHVQYIAVSDNHAPIEPAFLERGGRLPSALPARVQRALEETAVDVLLGLGVRDGCVHFEARWTSRGAIPIEANLRLGGAEVFAFHRAVYDVDLVEQAVRIALGLPVQVPLASPPKTHVASAAFNPTTSGTFRSARLSEHAARSPHLVECVFFAQPGDRIRLPPEGYDYLGWLVASGDTEAEAAAHCAKLVAAAEINIEPQPKHAAGDSQ